MRRSKAFVVIFKINIINKDFTILESKYNENKISFKEHIETKKHTKKFFRLNNKPLLRKGHRKTGKDMLAIANRRNIR